MKAGLALDYAAMNEKFLKDPPGFEFIMDSLAALEQKINYHAKANGHSPFSTFGNARKCVRMTNGSIMMEFSGIFTHSFTHFDFVSIFI